MLERSRGVDLSGSLLAGGAVVLLSFSEGGFFERTWTPATVAFAAVAALTVVLRPDPPLSRLEVVLFGGLAALAAWQALSASWSLEPAASLRDAQRGLVYVAAALALVVLARRGAAAAVLVGMVAGSLVVSGYSLALRAVEGPRDVPYQGFVLNEPLGYANALGILAALGLVGLLGLAVRRPSRRAVVLAAPAGLLFATVLALTASRGSWFAAAIGAVTLVGFLFAPTRARVAVPAGAAVVVAALLSLPLVADPAALERGLSDRPHYWSTAWQAIPDYAPLGSGAGTFATLWAVDPPVPRDVLDAHSLYLEALVELGPVGLALVLMALLAPLVAGLRSPPTWPVATAAGAYVAFLVHAGLDWDWEMPAVTVAGLACGAALLGHESSPRLSRAGGRSIAAATAVLLAAATTSWILSG